jgi:hypothetical protein
MAVFNCSPYLQLATSCESVSLSAVVLDKRQHGVTLRSLAETPTGPMTMRGNGEAFIYWPRMARKRGYGTALNYGRDVTVNECIMARIAVYISRMGKANSASQRGLHVGPGGLRAAVRAHCPL